MHRVVVITMVRLDIKLLFSVTQAPIERAK